MARVTVEDCIEEIPNRFELVVLTQKELEIFHLELLLQLNAIMTKIQL